jgi:hypothetical protein
MVLAIVGLITIPVEAMLLPVARTPDASTAAVEWVSGLDHADLVEAAAEIDAYPALYRRAIMGGLEPAERSQAWRQFLQRYIDAHPSLTQAQMQVLRDAVDVASPEAFAAPLPAPIKARISEVFEKATAVLGPQAANELFVTLGPKDLKGRNPLPLTQKVADRVRSWRVASAGGSDCNCNIEIDTCDLSWDPWLQCSELYTCTFDLEWPMCGPLWSWACTGWCKMIKFPWEMDNQ